MKKALHFSDTNFKLAVLNKLADLKLVQIIDPRDFANNFAGRKIDIDKEGYDVIPEILDHYLAIDVTEDMVATIDEIYMDGGDDIYMSIAPLWNGEDEQFNIRSANDCRLIPNLKKITLFWSDGPDYLDQFKVYGVEAKFV